MTGRTPTIDAELDRGRFLLNQAQHSSHDGAWHRVAGELVLFVKGAPEEVLSRAVGVDVEGRHEPLTAERAQEIAGAAMEMADRGLRVLALGYRALPAGRGPCGRSEQGIRERIQGHHRFHHAVGEATRFCAIGHLRASMTRPRARLTNIRQQLALQPRRSAALPAIRDRSWGTIRCRWLGTRCASMCGMATDVRQSLGWPERFATVTSKRANPAALSAASRLTTTTALLATVASSGGLLSDLSRDNGFVGGAWQSPGHPR